MVVLQNFERHQMYHELFLAQLMIFSLHHVFIAELISHDILFFLKPRSFISDVPYLIVIIFL